MTATQETKPRVRLLVAGECDVTLWSMSAEERHRRAFQRAGATPLDGATLSADESVVVVRADYLLGNDLVAALVARRDVILTAATSDTAIALHVSAADCEQATHWLAHAADEAPPPALARLERLRPEELGDTYDHALRKRATPLALSYIDTPILELERRTFGAAYKGATDFVTKWLWPRPAHRVTRWAAACGLSPNTITSASLLLVIIATVLFAHGLFLAALPIAWAMTFLDTVDGKLARVTLTSSAWGNIYDHGIDLIHPPFWWWAWYLGLQTRPDTALAPLLEPALWIILAGYLAGRLLEGAFVLAFRIETHIWRPVDYYFRTITARRNPNLAILMVATLLGRPDAGFVAVAAWTVFSLGFHTVRLAQAALVRATGKPVVSWLTDAP